MLKRARMALPWPRLIAVFSGVFGAAVAVATATKISVAHSLRAQTGPELVASICGCFFLFLAFPLYAGRDWARRALLLTTYCIVAALAIFASPTIFSEPHSSKLSFQSIPYLVVSACALVAFLTPPAFLLAVLHHPEVRLSFQKKDASNQALQPTAGREENYKDEIKK